MVEVSIDNAAGDVMAEAFRQRQSAMLDSVGRNTKRSGYGSRGGSGLSRWEERRMTLLDDKKTVRAGTSRRRQTKKKKTVELKRFCSVYVKW